jgi:predicted O-methyltransferase YrrM
VVELKHEDIMNYVSNLVGEGDDQKAAARQLSEEYIEHGVVSIDPTRGRFLELVARLKAPQRVLEIGPGVGYSALWFFQGMGRKGRLEAVEISPAIAKEFRATVAMAGLRRRVRVHVGPALSTLRKLRGTYDIVFIDADKDEYPQYLEYALKLTKPGAVILADNMLWSGATFLREVRKAGVEGILEYTKRIFTDPRLSSVIVPLGDGVAFSVRTK